MSFEPEGETPSPFDAEAALQQLRRALRELKLAERGAGYELRGRRIAELKIDGDAVAARLARRPALSPEWDLRRLAGVEAQRQWLVELKKRLARWEAED
jgi:hypothetical protein